VSTGFLEELGRYASPVVGDDDLDGTSALLCAELDGRTRRLSCRLSLGRRLDSMAHRVADHVHERLGQAFQNDSIELGAVPADQELDVLALGGRDVAHGARKRRRDRRERQHAHLDRGVLQLAEQPATQVELVGDRLVLDDAIAADHVLEPATVENGLGHEVEQAVDLLWRYANRAPVGSQALPSSAQRRRPDRRACRRRRSPSWLRGRRAARV